MVAAKRHRSALAGAVSASKKIESDTVVGAAGALAVAPPPETSRINLARRSAVFQAGDCVRTATQRK